MQLPVVTAVQLRGEHLFCLERPGGAEQFLLDPPLGHGPGGGTRRPARPAIGTADAARAVDWFEARRTGPLHRRRHERGRQRGLRAAGARHRRRRRRGEADPRHHGLQRGMGARQHRLRLHALPDGRPVPPDRAPPRARVSAWQDDPVVWAEHPTPQAWPDVVDLARTAPGCSCTSWSAGRRSTSHLLERATRHGGRPR